MRLHPHLWTAWADISLLKKTCRKYVGYTLGESHTEEVEGAVLIQERRCTVCNVAERRQVA